MKKKDKTKGKEKAKVEGGNNVLEVSLMVVLCVNPV